jgi:diaminopimelate epimerase
MLRFTKMQGLGNDFVVVGAEAAVTPELVTALCHRRFGVGADGLLRVSRPQETVVMEYWNADGSVSEMCGNGLRCVARAAYDRGLETTPAFTVVTPAGRRDVEVDEATVSVDLGPTRIGDAVRIGDRDYTTVSVGNPHAVTAVDDPSAFDVPGVGSIVERHPMFPAGTNVEFVRRSAPDAIEMRVWERGVGETLACGSGMVAAAAVAHRDGAPAGIRVDVPGGTATVRFDGTRSWLTGPAEYVFEGEWLSGPS